MTHSVVRPMYALLPFAAWLGVLVWPLTAAALTLHHIHGLSYSADGKQLYIPMHHGLAIYSAGEWSQAPGPAHDYMGFSVTREFFYSSGHPAPGSSLKNPFGLIRSKDQGKTWEHLGLTGESDFHLLATSYQTNTVYVFNPAPNSRMPSAGLYYTTNNGQQWQKAKADGLGGTPASLAVHPSQDGIAAVGTRSGVYLTQDYGATFQPLANAPQALAVSFSVDGQHLWYSSFDGAPALTRVQWQSGQREHIPLPPLDQDTVMYIVQNPVNTREWAIATYKRHVFLSQDAGQTWTQIAHQGVAR